MKKIISMFIIICLIMTVLPAVVFATSADVWVGSSGNDENSGTEQEPYATFGKALDSVADGATIHIVDTVSVPADFSWSAHGKSITVTGGVLDFTAMGNRVTIGDSVHFHNMTLKFDDNDYVFAAGNQVIIGENVTVSAMINLFGGGNEAVVASTDLTVLSGNYYNVFGGGYKADVTGDVKLTVGGNTNAAAGAPGDANNKYMIFGGNCHGTIHGKTSLTFTGNAIANYIFGGGAYSGDIKGGAETLISGGQAMTVYGASYKVTQNFDAQLVITGGQMEQVFGGSLEAAHKGDVTVQLLGGEITRRVYGGCYNDYSGSWESDNYVEGNISLTISGEADISFSGSNMDEAIYARSRHATVSAAEVSKLIFLDTAAVEKYSSKLGAQDSTMQSIMGDVTAADTIVYPVIAQVGDSQYSSLQEAVDNSGGNVVTLMSDCGSANVSADLILDLNGYNATGISVTEDATLYLLDSATNDYEGTYGTAQVTGNVASFTEADGKSYLVVCENGNYSAHGYEVKLTHVSLDPANDALGYKAQLFGDEIVCKYVSEIGFNLWVNSSNVVTRSKSFDGKTVVTLRLQNILAAGGGEMTINGNAFIKFSMDQKTVTTDDHATTMKSVLETVNENFSSYSTAQKRAVQALVAQYQADMEGWTLDNILGWDSRCTVSGTLVMVDRTQLPDALYFDSGVEITEVSVAEDGSFAATLPSGDYEILLNAEGYRAATTNITVTEGENALGTIKVLQALTQDHAWRDGATKTESGSGVTISTVSGVDTNSGTEYKIGNSLDCATEWIAETYIEAGATGLVGFTVGRDDGNNGTIFFNIDKAAQTAGFYTWGTFKYDGSLTVRGDTSGSFTNLYSRGFTVSDAVKDALNSRYKLTLKATDITEEGTGTLTLFVNDMECLRMDASGFTGVLASGTDGVTGQKPDLANSHVSLVVKGANISATFTDYYVTELNYGTVSGKLVKLDGTAGFPETVTLTAGLISWEVSVAEDGSFSAQMPVGSYTLTAALDGYKVVCDIFSVTEGQTTDVTVKLLQNLTADYKWWGGSTKTEDGASVTLRTDSGVNALSATEYKIGNTIQNATSWTAETWVEADSNGKVGISVGRDDGKNGTILFYIDKGQNTCGFFTWDSFQYAGNLGLRGEQTEYTIESTRSGNYSLREILGDALNSRYKLTLKATDITQEGTGTLTLYVNDIECLKMYAANFTGLKVDDYKGIDDQKPDLANSHVSLVVVGANISATFTDYYYAAEQNYGAVSGKLVKLDGTAGFPEAVTLTSGSNGWEVSVAEDGTFSAQMPVGSYTLTAALDGYRAVCDNFSIADGQTTEVTVKLLQNLTQDYKWWGGSTKTEEGASVTLRTDSGVNALSATEYKIGNTIQNATSWTVETWIEADSNGKVGISVGRDDGKNGTILFYIDKGQNTCGFFTWDSFQYTGNLGLRGEQSEPTITAQKSGNYSLKTILGDALKSRYKLTLKATDITQEGTGTLTLYVNDIECLKMYAANFTGLKVDDYKGVADQKPDLANSHVSLVVQGANISATFTDYYYIYETEE